MAEKFAPCFAVTIKRRRNLTKQVPTKEQINLHHYRDSIMFDVPLRYLHLLVEIPNSNFSVILL
jgi:hypothetical protein